ncbi:hypothetical protein E2C01_084522 [Portunus trituberculatus]|uniref:Uncharacterized protein n=1 Tax=Portunus trituberculatus TaxID=210409 RepID=A0A5B7J9H7_PORTR|nr:hypothetical protein [Portunus trituberculatus]
MHPSSCSLTLPGTLEPWNPGILESSCPSLQRKHIPLEPHLECPSWNTRPLRAVLESSVEISLFHKAVLNHRVLVILSLEPDWN